MAGRGLTLRGLTRFLLAAHLAMGIVPSARAAQAPVPSVSLNPTCLSADGVPREVGVTGSNFTPGVTASVHADAVERAKAEVGPNGDFLITVTVTGTAGDHPIRAIEESPTAEKSATAVLRSPCPEPIGPSVPPQTIETVQEVDTAGIQVPPLTAGLLVNFADAQQMLDQAVAEFEVAAVRLEELKEAIDSTEQRLERLLVETNIATERLEDRAAAIYKANGVSVLASVLMSGSIREAITKLTLYRAGMGGDVHALQEANDARQEALATLADLKQEREQQESGLSQMNLRQMQAVATLQELYRLSGADFTQLSPVFIAIGATASQFVFPVVPPYSYSDSWGAPRMEGTRFYHLHEGTDVFAPSGTPILAVVDGVIENMGTASLGGIKLWLRSPSDGWSYYYAHLSAYAPGISNGSQVRRGQVIGYVGNTGNARWTLPHVHFEIHDPTGAAINPYPVLRATDARSMGEL